MSRQLPRRSEEPLRGAARPREAGGVPWRKPRKGVSLFAILTLLALLLLPSFALLKISRKVDWRLVLVAAVAISAMTFFAFWEDKRRAQSGGWRTTEFALHFLELIGGWPGAFLAQRVVRHKIVKVKYQVAFWAIVAIHQLVAFDFAQDWRWVRKAVNTVRVPAARP